MEKHPRFPGGNQNTETQQENQKWDSGKQEIWTQGLEKKPAKLPAQCIQTVEYTSRL